MDCGDTEEIQQRHRQERKELQSKITALKKGIPKNDKKKKKEIADTIAKLEEELTAKHNQELEALKTTSPENTNGVSEEAPAEPPEELEDVPEAKITRAQRRRLKKENEDKERNKRISEQEEINKEGPRMVELNSINEVLKQNKLQIYSVPADGNCLYCSIQHQLEETDRESHDVNVLRKMTADFIRQNKDDFLPFMCNDDEELVNEEQFDKYCNDVANTKLWGGQLELRALSNVLKCPIKIIQSAGPTTLQGEQFEGPPLTLTYHRHLYRLGEHYNSTVAFREGNEDDS